MGMKHPMPYKTAYAPRHITGRHGRSDEWKPRPHLRPNARTTNAPQQFSLDALVRALVQQITGGKS